MLKQLLEKYKLGYDDLTAAERETLHNWLETLNKRELTIERLKDFVSQLAANTARELADIPDPGTLSYLLYRHYWKKKDVFLRARLRNYLMLQDFVTGPEKAKKWIEDQLSNIK